MDISYPTALAAATAAALPLVDKVDFAACPLAVRASKGLSEYYLETTHLTIAAAPAAPMCLQSPCQNLEP